jgi:2-dehydropantoate 2-reductase
MAGEPALAGHEVCAIARGAHLGAIRSHGLKLIVEGQTKDGSATSHCVQA